MAINKESNTYTILFATIMVVVVGGILAFLSLSLKPMQEANGKIKKKMEILKALLTTEEFQTISRSNADAKYADYIKAEIVLDQSGKVIQEGKDAAFNVDIKSEYKDKNLPAVKRSFPMFIAEKNGKKLYVIPIIGKGLWGPIWGNVCIAEDKRSISGASFGHQGETPGLGAEISQGFFIDRWTKGDEKISDDNGDFTPFEVVKDGTGPNPTKIDGISGGTITSKGVEEMVNRCLVPYTIYFKSLK
ncbi:MAG: NADH:ubiquinone reductase (Na(+)-transporting) subunit C [Flavobacteriales bacterium]|nr:NADH:ubiquinone reductase (Na(+)-transporting) subunit C [Flavobacteriales bacterium]